jgi:two-component system sensor histidine kinase YesM
MTPEALESLYSPVIDQDAPSFGLRGTIKRISLFYGEGDIFEIESAPGEGTSVLLKIPSIREDDPNFEGETDETAHCGG